MLRASFSPRVPALLSVSTLLAALAAGLGMAADPLPADAVARARVRVLAGLFERTDFRATLPLLSARMVESLGGGPLAGLRATAVDLTSGRHVACEIALRAEERKVKLPRPASIDIAFAVDGPVPVMGSRDFEIVLSTAGVAGAAVKHGPPFSAIVPVEVRLLSLEIAGKGLVYQSAPTPDAANVAVNGAFDADAWLADSAGPGWSARAFRYAAEGRLERAVDPVRGGFARIRQADDDARGFVSAPFQVRPGARYRVSLATCGDASAYSDAATSVNVMLRLVGPAGEEDRGNRWEVNWPDLPLTQSWTSHSKTLAVPHGPRWGYLVVRAVAKSQFCLDDVRVEELDRLPASIVFDSERAFLPPRRDAQEGRSQDVLWDGATNALTLRPVENLVGGGDFEADGEWSYSHPALFELSPAAKWSGERGLSLKSGAGASAQPLVAVASREVTIESDRPYALSLAYRAVGGGSMTRVRLETETRAILVDDVLPPWFQRAGSGWLRRSWVVPAGLAAATPTRIRATLSLMHENRGGGTPTYIDDVCLTEGAAAAPFAKNRTYPGEGMVLSEIADLGCGGVATLDWTATVPEGTSVALFTRCGATPYYDAACWAPWRPASRGAAITTLGRGLDGYVQWKAEIPTHRADATPRLQRVEIVRGNADAVRSPRVRVVALDAGEVTPAALDWLAWVAREEPLAEWLKEPGFVEMSAAARRVIAPFTDDFDRQMALMQYYTNNVAVVYGGAPDTRRPAPKKPFTPFTYYRWLEASTRGEGNLICSHFGIVHCFLCRGAGIPARMMSLGSISGSGHNMSEVWSDRFQKWYFSDAEYGGCLTLDGVPQSLQDIQELYRRGEYSRLRTRVSARNRVPYMPFENAWGRMSDGRFVGRSNKDPMSDILGTHLLGWTEERVDLFRWYIPEDALFMREPAYTSIGDGRSTFSGGWFSDPERLRFKLNQVEMRFDLDGPDRVIVRLRHSGWDFDHYEIAANGQVIEQKGDSFAWPLKAGANRIEVRTISVQGHRGKSFSADLWLAPEN
jgi:hypothetical protein